jgi:hypothetical protein
MTDPEDEEVDGYYISSGWWVIWFNNWTFPKEARQQLLNYAANFHSRAKYSKP